MKKYTLYILILVTLIGFTIPVYAQTPTPNTNYHLLAPLPGVGDNGNINTTNGLGTYLNAMIKIFIGICAVLSVVMIVMGGIEYMTSELAHTKEAGKEKIEHAILGLLIALGAYALLFTINPDLLKSDVTIPNTTGTPAAPTDTNFQGNSGGTGGGGF